MTDICIRAFEPADQEKVIALWRACDLVRPQNDPARDIARKMRVNPELFLVAAIGNEIVGTVMAGYEGHRGWINYLAVCPRHRKIAIGSRMMAHAETLLRAMGCPKINLQVLYSNKEVVEFYRRIGFSEDPDISLGKRLEHDDRRNGEL
jgi:ribosomal protein S18 acetylase RimI-like enzyme